jgi:pilus assembly protein CpaE
MMLNKFFSRNSTDDSGGFTPETKHLSSSQANFTQAKERQEQTKETMAPAIAVLGAKGGVGTTSIAINLAIAIASGRMRTTIIDAHLQRPTLVHLLGTEPQHTLLELVDRRTHLDESLFRACTAEVDHLLPVRFISPPLNGSGGVKTNLTELTEVFERIRSYSDVWVIDVPPNLDRHLVTMLDCCSKIALVFEATVAGVATCRRWLEVFKELGYDDKKVICVLNRAGSKFRAVEDQLNEVFADQKLFKIPNSAQLLWQSSTRGIPSLLLQPKSPYARSIIKVAQAAVDSFTQE